MGAVPGRAAQIDHAELARRWLAGELLHEIRAAMGATASVSTYHKRIQSLGLPRRTKSSGSLPQSEIVRAYQCGMASHEIGARIGISERQILRVLHANHVELRPSGIAASVMRRQCTAAVQLWRAGRTMREIAKALGITYCQARVRVRKVLGPQSRGNEPKVTTDRLLAMLDAGKTKAEIARIVGVRFQTITKRLARARRSA